MKRREFIGAALGVSVATVALRGSVYPTEGGRNDAPSRSKPPPLIPCADLQPTGRSVAGDSILSLPASECPIDTVVVVVMENRSFDHYLGWLAGDEAYRQAGHSRYGRNFKINGDVHQSYRKPSGQSVSTRPARSFQTEDVVTRGCAHRDPGHSWDSARVQRDHGFVASGTGADEFALAYYTQDDLPVHAALARRFTVFDHWHSSLLGPTFPNRQYLISGQSEGRKADPDLATNETPLTTGIYHAETIFERLQRAGVSSRYYHTNIPILALWGTDRTAPFISSLDRYFEDAAAGALPRVAFVEPQFGGGDAYRTDDHPRGDVGLGQRWIREVFRAFVESPHWKRGAFIVTYDEGGGFFDHVTPPLFADERASMRDQNNFGQGGFRVPTLLASPYASPGAVDHRRYDHTAILRFLEWRYLGAPPEGCGDGQWALTLRDRASLNMGATLRAAQTDPELGFDLAMNIPPPAPSCTAAHAARRPPDLDPDPFDHPELDALSKQFPRASYKPWLADVRTALG